jgi:hypothetical protein
MKRTLVRLTKKPTLMPRSGHQMRHERIEHPSGIPMKSMG